MWLTCGGKGKPVIVSPFNVPRPQSHNNYSDYSRCWDTLPTFPWGAEALVPQLLRGLAAESSQLNLYLALPLAEGSHLAQGHTPHAKEQWHRVTGEGYKGLHNTKGPLQLLLRSAEALCCNSTSSSVLSWVLLSLQMLILCVLSLSQSTSWVSR